MTRNFAVFLAGLAALALVLAPIFAFAVELTDEEKEQCRERGGCILVPMDSLREKLLEVFERGHEAGRISCGNRT